MTITTRAANELYTQPKERLKDLCLEFDNIAQVVASEKINSKKIILRQTGNSGDAKVKSIRQY